MQKNNWVAEEITFQRDYEQWVNNELNEQEKVFDHFGHELISHKPVVEVTVKDMKLGNQEQLSVSEFITKLQ